jgi:asparagine synthase (glutamine-hydrolysing)
MGKGQRSEVIGQRTEFGKFAIRDPQSEIGVPPDTSRLTPNEIDVINAVSRYELQGYMTNTLLRDTDQMSMAHALEVRVPFVDSKVVNYVLSLPGVWKIDGNRPKPLLLDALGELLPEEIWKRRKMGFTLPFRRWLMAGLKKPIAENMSNSDFARLGVNTELVRCVWDSFQKDPTNEPWSRPWALYVLSKWCESNGISV